MNATASNESPLLTAIAVLDAELQGRFGVGLTEEQRECLTDPERYVEALDMVDDMEFRLGISGYARGEVASALTDREHARDAA